jgi:hypothetical protein
MEKKNLILIEESTAFDMRFKCQGEPAELVVMLCGAMTIDPKFKALIETALEYLPHFQATITPSIGKDFNGNIQQ